MDIQTIIRDKETWFKITDSDTIRPFFMNIVSDSNHWMFISSNGGLSAGRKNTQYALFPYYTDDKITEFADITGSKSIFLIHAVDQVHIWEPFSEYNSNKFNTSRNLFKNYHGNKIMFEEINHDLELIFRYQWNTGKLFGFVRKAELVNNSDSNHLITMLDGIQNIMPYGVEPEMQNTTSNLVDAYKRSELLDETGMGIYALSAIIVDKAEPSEALKANVAWSLGVNKPKYLLSSIQLDEFRKGRPIREEHDVKGEKGAYFIHTEIHLEPNAVKTWKIIANVNQNHTQVIGLNHKIKERSDIDQLVEKDIEEGTRTLKELTMGADGMRLTADLLKDARHHANVLFNIMRGGTFDCNYQIEKKDLVSYLLNASKKVLERNQDYIQNLNETLNARELYDSLSGCKDPDLYRLCKVYLPLKFSRRHGDPSRPWNQFSINTHCEFDGSKILDYQGNWRDIFQNWEALVHSYPDFIEGMIFKFLNATTFDGYNPYRVTKSGFDWETIEPDNPWSYIGYWGDHQIIYLLKLLEFYQRHQPDALVSLLDRDCFVYANVPYRIKTYQNMVTDPKKTITFDDLLDKSIRKNVAGNGTDAALLGNSTSDIHRVNFLEKILATVLAKVSNFIPEGGIWMNTQRPEWNDANNALVGNGVSMVTLYYLRRFLKFFESIIVYTEIEHILVSEELKDYFDRISGVLHDHQDLLFSGIDDRARKKITDALGQAGSDYRICIYINGFSGKKASVRLEQISDFVRTALKYLEHSIDANRRPDHLYHSYNLMSMQKSGISIFHLDEMLEGQVAVLSSGYLHFEESNKLLDALRNCALYRKDQNSYMLYPDKELPRFLEKNIIPETLVKKSVLLQKLLVDNNIRVINMDIQGGYHFNGNFRNADDVEAALEELKSTEYKELVEEEAKLVLQIFEEVFNHKSFTGRSGTFFAYEGLGSIYWHMVSKLHLAVQEVCLGAMDSQVKDTVIKGLVTHYHDIGEGIGIHKSPEEYGAFPTDPYSHTPKHRGAQQPGMTGQVKEDILVSIGELGVIVDRGRLAFRPRLLKKSDFSSQTGNLEFVNVRQEDQLVRLSENALCFSYCQIPVIYQIGDDNFVEVRMFDDKNRQYTDLSMDTEMSTRIFRRTGEVKEIVVTLQSVHLVKH